MKQIHATVILALHCEDDETRDTAKAFVVNNTGSLAIDFYNIGVCDHIIREHFREAGQQEAYWPFLDLLHTRHIHRVSKSVNLLMYEAIEPASSLEFEDDLEKLYRESLKLRIPAKLLEQTRKWIC